MAYWILLFFFFFQAEDGIRDLIVTGVQTCALPISKLDGTERVTYPNKEELYRRTQKIVPFKTWMRIAAAIILIAFMGMLYWQNSSVTNKIQPNIAIKNTINKKIQPAEPIKIIQDKNTLSEKPVEQVAEIKSSIKKKRAIKKD